jgi:predicted TIM-barrel fold metal-dependent hydrolase
MRLQVALEELSRRGFCGVRFNPSTFDEFPGRLASPVGLALYHAAGRLGMPVGVMLFKGLLEYLAEIDSLVASSPDTTLVIDHFGFFKQAGVVNEEAFEALLALSSHSQIYVKVSAFMRVSVRALVHNDVGTCVEPSCQCWHVC